MVTVLLASDTGAKLQQLASTVKGAKVAPAGMVTTFDAPAIEHVIPTELLIT